MSVEHAGRVAFENTRQERISYGELWRQSGLLASYINENAPSGKPVVVYGHKSPLMIVSFIAALRAGRAYAPIDVAYPEDRVNDILDQIGNPFVVSLADMRFPGDLSRVSGVLERLEIEETVSRYGILDDESCWVSGDDGFYLLFTSGSTGRPKGVQMSVKNVDAFMDYFSSLTPDDDYQISFNRVPYTFDVSLFDIIPGLSSGATLFSLEAECEAKMAKMFEAFASSGMTTWISTPSFVEMCLADAQFDQGLLPRLRNIILCGEVLRSSVARSLIDRFPLAKVVNTYGPTETQAVCDIVIDGDVLDRFDPLPVGYMSQGMNAHIVDPDTLAPVNVGEEGEILLSGDTVSLGYYGRPDLTNKAFVDIQLESGENTRSYRTGDKGYLDEGGRLFCLGRFDFQVKLNGFRIELGDVEQNVNNLDYVENSVVLPAYRDGKPTHLVAHVVLSDEALPRSFKTGQRIRQDLKRTIPEYMVPKKIVFHEAFTLNANGKVDRKALS